jgi:FMN-dependent oxidoreductase (nitrilotriacetate monooxygenase family)
MTSTDKKKVALSYLEFPHPVYGGQWALSGDHGNRMGDPEHWATLAKTLEAGLLDFFFFGDSYGHLLLGGERPDIASTQSLDLPRVDPALMIAAIARETKNIGYVMTGSTTFEQPYAWARRLGTLDHITNGRMGWNVVTTSWQESTARAFGTEGIEHDERYVLAAEHMELVYRLLEESWEDDAIVMDRERGIFADPSKVHTIVHEGKYFKTNAPGNTPPSPQRMPVVIQAAGSPAGLDVAARLTEVSFLLGSTDEALKRKIDTIRAAVVANGRSHDAVKFLVGLSVVIGDTTDHARKLHQSYVDLNSWEAAAASFASFTGIDLRGYDINTPLTEVKQKSQMLSQIERQFDGNATPTVESVLTGQKTTMGARGLHAIGTVEDVADRIEELVEVTGVDGFLIEPFVHHDDAVTLVERLVPELQKRGRFRTEYEEHTLRERLFGAGHARLPDDYPLRRR